jgi:acyl-coenzyme A thioesterase PaaI-like protein
VTTIKPSFMQPEPGKLMGRGHPAGDFLEAFNWTVLDETEGHLQVEAVLPSQVLNPRGQLFGGFTGTYVDLIGLHTVRAGPGRNDPNEPRIWMATTNMRIDYFEPILGPTFVMDSRLQRSRGRDRYVITEFFQDGVLAVHAISQWKTLRDQTALSNSSALSNR